MVHKFIIIILILISNISFSNIIYDKNEILITEIELNQYIDLYKNTYNKYLEKNKAVKNIVLIKQTINSLKKNNKIFLERLDNEIEIEYGNEIFKTQIVIDFIRYNKIRNEFITNYFINNFKLNDLKMIFTSLEELKLPVSKGNCLIIDKIKDLKNDNIFLNSLFESFKNNNKNFQTKINDQLYSVCINEIAYKKIENMIINYIEIKTQNDFNKFIYGKRFWIKN